MAAETTKIKSKLAALSSSLDELETMIEPLFLQSLPETIVALEPLQQAKLQTVLPYAVYDLIFIYLKLKGIDPKTHPVISELDRIRQYFEKISITENPPAKRTEIDKEAAGRFIKHAISQVKWVKTAAEEAQEIGSEEPAKSSTCRIPVKVTNKMLERADYENSLRKENLNEEEDDILEVFEENNEPQDEPIEVDEDNENEGGKSDEKEEISTSNKRRRPVIDPFAGYGEDQTSLSNVTSKKPRSEATRSPAVSMSTSALSNASKSPKKKKKKKKTNSTSNSPSPAKDDFSNKLPIEIK